ncbi:MAG: hemerythrin family protein [Proteobacteria bacterium]|nr:hemerythrin family protein [Pseudomonadota bacterium]
MYSLLPSMQTGISHIDSEHQDLVAAINRIEAAALSQDAPAVLACLDAFRTELTGHFLNEERYLRMMQYPACDSHSHHHAEVVASIDQLRRGVSAGGVDLANVAPECFTDLLGAVVTMDMRFLNWLEDQRLKGPTSGGGQALTRRPTLKRARRRSLAAFKPRFLRALPTSEMSRQGRLRHEAKILISLREMAHPEGLEPPTF